MRRAIAALCLSFAATSGAADWQATRETDPFTEATGAHLTTGARDASDCGGRPPALTIGCTEGQTWVLFGHGCHDPGLHRTPQQIGVGVRAGTIPPTTDAQVRFGTARPGQYTLDAIERGAFVGWMKSNAAQAFARRIAATDSFAIRLFRQDGTRATTATFDTRGLTEALRDNGDLCNWSEIADRAARDRARAIQD